MTIECPKCKTENPDSKSYCGDCGTPLPDIKEAVHTKTMETPVEELTRGSTFAGRYEIIEELGKGGMGKVYRVEDAKTKEEIALKLIKPEIASDKKTIERFRNELTTARKIRHKNVCGMFDLGEDKDTHFITMEFVEGQDLKKLIRQSGQLAIGTVINITKQVCDGLAEAHRSGVVHRDLKPSNIMIDADGNARIMDFGIARSLRGKGITGAGVMIGTPEYMSPEQVEAKDVDQRSDIYSLGIILYEMTTGRLPFEADTPFAVGVKQKSEVPKPPKEFNPQISDDLNRVILNCLEKEKDARYQSAGEVRSELESIEKGIPTTDIETPRLKPATSKEIIVTVQRRWVYFAIPVVVIIVALLAFLLLKGGKEAPVSGNMMLVVLPFENLGPSEDEYFADGVTDEITNRLSALHGLDVISRTSAIQYKKTDKTINQIREELDADYVVTGTVSWDKSIGVHGRIRVSPQLIQASDDTQLWSERYERDMEGIFSVQSEIAEEIIKQLDLKILAPSREAIQAKPTKNLKAYDFYLRGLNHRDRAFLNIEPKEFLDAVKMFEGAVELDPDFVQAYIQLSMLHSIIFHHGIDHTTDRVTQAKMAVDKALELDQDLPESKRALGFYYYHGFRDYEKALELFESIRRARPNSSPDLIGYIQRRQGKWEESQETLKEAFRLDPRSSLLANEIACNYTYMRQYEEAEKWYDRALSLSPEGIFIKIYKAFNSLHSKETTDEALAVLETMPPSFWTDWGHLWAESIDGNHERELEILDSLDYDSFEFQILYFNKDLWYAGVYCYGIEKPDLMRSHANKARFTLEDLVKEHPEDPRYRSELGRAYAYLGRKVDAVREGRQAVNLYPVSKDAVGGPRYVMTLAEILIIIGEHEQAIEQLEYLISIPTGVDLSLDRLQSDPRFDPLRGHPRFIALVEKYSK